LPAAEATLTTRAGAGAARSAGSAASMQRYVPSTLTSYGRRQSSSLKASKASTTTTPAPLTRTESCCIAANAPVTDRGSVTSSSTA
jgi:hypothetical protein